MTLGRLCSLNIILLHITSKLRHVEKYFLLLTANFQDKESSKIIILCKIRAVRRWWTAVLFEHYMYLVA